MAQFGQSNNFQLLIIENVMFDTDVVLVEPLFIREDGEVWTWVLSLSQHTWDWFICGRGRPGIIFNLVVSQVYSQERELQGVIYKISGFYCYKFKCSKWIENFITYCRWISWAAFTQMKFYNASKYRDMKLCSHSHSPLLECWWP